MDSPYRAWYVYGPEVGTVSVIVKIVSTMHEGTVQIQFYPSGLHICVPPRLINRFTVVDDPGWTWPSPSWLPENTKVSDGGHTAGHPQAMAAVAAKK